MVNKPDFCPMKECRFIDIFPYEEYTPGQGFVCVGAMKDVSKDYGRVHVNTHNFCLWTPAGWNKIRVKAKDAKMFIYMLTKIIEDSEKEGKKYG